jgi:AcrR family transcriptional regulator
VTELSNGLRRAVKLTSETGGQKPRAKNSAITIVPSAPVKDKPQLSRIREISADLFAQKGYNGVGISEIGEAVGLARGALYYHINSKEELLYGIVVQYIDELVVAGERIAAEMPDPVARIRLLSRYLMQTIGAHINEMTVCFREVNSLTGERHAVVSTQHSRYQAIWGKAIEDGVKLGVFRPLPPVALKGLLGMYFYSFLWLNPRGRQAPEEIGEVFCELVFRGITANPRAAVKRAKL